MKLAGEFHGWLPLNKQQKILKVLQLMQFPSSDALSYVNFCEGRIDSVIQCVNKIWDIHAIIPIIKASGGIASTWNNKDPKNAGTISFPRKAKPITSLSYFKRGKGNLLEKYFCLKDT